VKSEKKASEPGNDNHFVIPSQDGIQRIKSGSIQNFPLPSAPHYIFCGQDFIDIQVRSSYTPYITSPILMEVFVKDFKRENGRKKVCPFDRDNTERWLSL
jgi:hypothetical protein